MAKDSINRKQKQATPPPPPNWGPVWLEAWAQQVGAEVRAWPISAKKNGNGKGQDAPPQATQATPATPAPPPPQASDEDCLQRVRRAVNTSEDLVQAARLDAIGERKAARSARESAFIAALATWVDCAEAVLVADAVNGLALLLGVSPETIRRYLAVYASPFGPFVIDGDHVRRR